MVVDGLLFILQHGGLKMRVSTTTRTTSEAIFSDTDRRRITDLIYRLYRLRPGEILDSWIFAELLNILNFYHTHNYQEQTHSSWAINNRTSSANRIY